MATHRKAKRETESPDLQFLDRLGFVRAMVRLPASLATSPSVHPPPYDEFRGSPAGPEDA